MDINVNTNAEKAYKEDIMLGTILDEWVIEVKEKVERFVQELKSPCDFSRLETELCCMVNELVNNLLQAVAQETFSDEGFLATLRQFGTSLGLRLKGYREVPVYVYTGFRIRIKSPYFVVKGKKRGRKKSGPNGRGKHLGLEVLGFIERGSCHFVSEIVKLALLCPSLTVTREILCERGIVLNVKTIRRYCHALGHRGRDERGAVSSQTREPLTGQTLVIGVDGGRIRERIAKKGKRKQGQKRRGYRTDWREPKLLTVSLKDVEGNPVKTFEPIHDATLGNDEAVFALLEKYLRQLDIVSIERVVFTGDGAPWIWTQVQQLIVRLKLDSKRVFQVIDYAHAAQNLYEIVELGGQSIGNVFFESGKLSCSEETLTVLVRPSARFSTGQNSNKL